MNVDGKNYTNSFCIFIYEFSIKDKVMIKSGKVWSFDMMGGKAYETSKIKSTASTMSSHPV